MSSTALTCSEHDGSTPAINLAPTGGQAFQLRRTGDQPVVFDGELVAEAAGVQINGRDRDRGHDVRIYRTITGTYVVEVVYWTTWAGEAEARTVVPAGRDAASVAAVFRAHNPLAHVLGYPPVERFRARQERLLIRLREDFATRVSDVLARLPDAGQRIK